MKDLAPSALNKLRRNDLLETRAYIDGRWVTGEGSLDVTDPANDQVIAQVAHCDESWVDLAVEAASRAFDGWRNTLPTQRGAVLRKWAALMRENQEDLAVIMTCEQGKPLSESRGEINYGANFVEWFAA